MLRSMHTALDPVEPALGSAAPVAPVVEIVIPVYNEEQALEASVLTLHAYLARQFPFSWRITIADNASTDGTWAIAQRLAAALVGVRAHHLDEKGRGRALRACWMASDATVVAYMDVDLSTDLDALLPLVAPLVSGHSDVAIGSRLLPGSRVVRGPKRELISRTYNRILRLVLHTRFRDAQCGFKALRADTARALLPSVVDEEWFFDTELLVLAQRSRLRIAEIPVDWVDDPDSRVHIARTAWDDLRGVARVLRQRRRVPIEGRTAQLPEGMGRQLAPFAVIGVICTAAYAGLYNVWRGGLGPFAANLAALVVTTILNTGANRRFTFGRRGRDGLVRDHLEATVALGFSLAASSAVLGLVRLLDSSPRALVDTVALLAAGTVATVIRFLVLRNWVFHPARRRSSTPEAITA